MQTTTPAVSTSSVAMRYGLLTGLVSVIYMFLSFATGQVANQALQWAGIVIPIGGIYLAHTAFKKSNGGFMSYGEGLGIGTILSLVSGVISTLFNYVYKSFIDPDVQTQMMNTMRTKLEEKGGLSDAQIDQAISMTTKFSTGPIGLVIGIVGALVMGVLISLVVAAFTKNSKPEFE
ncbi:MAG: DUF4199 domain-containing protein [Hymenobacter sp.]|nr:MAG: DUF4199 domain-containing protein [Hymenobacter sp.]